MRVALRSYDDNGVWTDDSGGGSGGGGYDSGSNWWDFLTPITTAAGKIVTNVYGQPNLKPGTVIIGPNGQQMIRYADGQMVPYVPGAGLNYPGVGRNGAISPLLVVGGIIALVVFVGMNKR